MEAAPQLWLQVSFVVDTFTFASTEDIITGLACIFCGIVAILVETRRNLERLRAAWHVMKNKAWEIFIQIVVIFLLLGSIVRACGIWTCESHILNLTSGCVYFDD